MALQLGVHALQGADAPLVPSGYAQQTQSWATAMSAMKEEQAERQRQLVHALNAAPISLACSHCGGKEEGGG